MSETLSATMAPPRRPTLHFDALYREARGDVYAYVASLVGDRATAEDVVAATFERAYRKRRSFDASRGTPRQWLFGIARNAALDELRTRARRATPVADAGTHVATAEADDDVSDERTLQIRAAIAGLSPRDRELIALKFFAGLSTAEIAGALGITEVNARQRVHRALRVLREVCA
ncbi:MAG: sigma-70 family RNA polymerase sigma factor [Patulibacter minatonensis]